MSDSDTTNDSSHDFETDPGVDDAETDSIGSFIDEGCEPAVDGDDVESADYDSLSRQERRQYDKKQAEKAAAEEAEFLRESESLVVDGKRSSRGIKTTADVVAELERDIASHQADLDECLEEIRIVKSSRPVDNLELEELEQARDIYQDRRDIAISKLDALKEKEVLVMGDYDRWQEELTEVEERALPAVNEELTIIQDAIGSGGINTSEKSVLQKRATSLKRKRTTLEKTRKRLRNDIEDYEEFQKELEEEESEYDDESEDSDFGPEFDGESEDSEFDDDDSD